MFDDHIDKFISSLKEDEFGAQTNVEKFYASDLFKDFNEIVLANLVGALKDMEITSGEFEELAKDYRLSYTEEQINKLISVTDPPRPSTNPPPGKIWVKERRKDGVAEWVLVDQT
jgi:hypothetical protein